MKQWNELTEEDFDFFREGMDSGRLFPTGMMNGGMIVYPVLSYLSYFLMHASLMDGEINSAWGPFLQFQFYSTMLLLVMSLVFFSKKLCVLFQKIELMVLILGSSKFAFDFVLLSLGMIHQKSPSFSIGWGLAVYGTFIFILITISVFRTLQMLRHGAFRKDGGGLLGRRFREKKNLFVSNTFFGIYGFIVVATLITAELNGVGGATFVCLMVVLMSVLIYCFGEIEFIFVLYCKFRFPSFTVTPEQVAKEAELDKVMKQDIKRIRRKQRDKERARKLAKKNKRAEKKDKSI